MKILELIKSTNIIKIYPEESLSAVIGKLGSSHDAGFVFGEEGKYHGVVSPYYCLIKSSFPANTKAEHCVFHAPHIKPNFPLSKVAQLMIESKIHYLPVFDDKEVFLGIISARRILGGLKGFPLFKIKIKEVLKDKKHPVVTTYDDDFISHALGQLKLYKISKLVVVNRDMKLRGILSYYDLISFLVAPKVKENRGDRLGDRQSLQHQKVRNFAKTMILTLTPEDTMEEALRLILEKRIGSVVIIDKEKHPLGIITTSDFLRLLMRERKGEVLEVVSRDLSKENRQIVSGFFSHINAQIHKIPDIVKARLFVKQEKQGGVFKVMLSLFPKRGSPKVIKQEGKNLVKVLTHIKDEEREEEARK